MKVAALWSGGKDSSYATYLAMKHGHKIKYLITMFPEREDSWMFHYPCIELTMLQAEAMGVKQITQKTKGEKEKELEDLKKVLGKIKDIDGIVSGAIASNYQKSRIDSICKELGLKNIAPLWGENPEKLLKEEIRLGFEIIITGVFAEGFDKNWLGRRIDEKCVENLKKLNKKGLIHLSGEGGCYESLVLDCPLFIKKLQIEESKIFWERLSGYLKVNKAKLVPKDDV